MVDNGSTDGSVEHVRRWFPEVDVISLPCNVGFAEGNNIGIQASQGEYVALLNNDTKADPDWLGALKTALDKHGEVGSCASKMLFYDRPDIINSAGDLYYSCGVASQRGCFQRDGRDFSRPEYVFGACGGAAMYRRAMFEDIGLFDEDFFAYDEDVDLSFRAQLMGYKCLFVPSAVIYHHYRGTSRHLWKTGFYLSRRNCLYALVKNLPTDLLFKNLLLILLYYVGGDVWHVLNGRGRSVIRSRFENLRNLTVVLRKRRAIQARRRVSSEYLSAVLTSWPVWKAIRFNLSRSSNSSPFPVPLGEGTDG